MTGKLDLAWVLQGCRCMGAWVVAGGICIGNLIELYENLTVLNLLVVLSD